MKTYTFISTGDDSHDIEDFLHSEFTRLDIKEVLRINNNQYRFVVEVEDDFDLKYFQSCMHEARYYTDLLYEGENISEDFKPVTDMNLLKEIKDTKAYHDYLEHESLFQSPLEAYIYKGNYYLIIFENLTFYSQYSSHNLYDVLLLTTDGKYYCSGSAEDTNDLVCSLRQAGYMDRYIRVIEEQKQNIGVIV